MLVASVVPRCGPNTSDVKTPGDGGQQAFAEIWLGTNKACWKVECFNVKQSLTMAAEVSRYECSRKRNRNCSEAK